MQHGQGAATYRDGHVYHGGWKEGAEHVQGTFTLTLADGSKYVGQWKNDKSHGQGTDTFATGPMYVGEKKDGKPWEGNEYNKNRNVIATYSEGVKKPVN